MSIATAAKEILTMTPRPDYVVDKTVCYGDLDLLHAIYDRAGLKLKNDHPMNQHEAVINGLTSHCNCKKPLFEKFYWQAHKGLARGFKLIVSEVGL